jgi:hypothetical protein
MNANQAITMLMRMFGRRLMNKGVNAGIRQMSKRGEGSATPQTPQQQKSVQATQRKARQGLNIARRFTKF